MNEWPKNKLAGKYLSSKTFSEDWAYVLENASVFNYWRMGEISLVHPIPNGLGTLVLLDDVPYQAKEGPLDLIERFFKLHRLMDYQLMRRTCESLPALPSRKVPIVNTHFSLFPTELPEDSVWLNPLAIAHSEEHKMNCLVELTCGLSVELPVHHKTLIRLSNKAVYALAIYRRDYSATLLTDGRPLEYVALPATPFGHLLSKQEFLQDWLSTPGEFFNHYKHQEYLQWYRSLSESDFDSLD